MPGAIAAYIGIAMVIAPESAGASIPDSTPLPPWVLGVETVAFVVACFVMWQHLRVLPFALEDTDMIHACKAMGRWLFITRHTLSLQCIHATVSFMGDVGFPIIPAAATHRIAVLVAGLGCFVTIQYFIMVVPHPDFQVLSNPFRETSRASASPRATTAELARWQEIGRKWLAKGVPSSTINHCLHTPAIFLGLVDTLVIKRRGLLVAQTPSLVSTCIYFMLYVASYMALVSFSHVLLPGQGTGGREACALTAASRLGSTRQVHWNYRITRAWPYGIMKSYGMSPFLWGKAMVVQSTVLCTLGTAVRAAVVHSQPCW